MDNRQNASIHDLFSRGSTPPMQSAQSQQYQIPPQGAATTHNISPGNQIDSLFQQLTSSSTPSDRHSADNYSSSVSETPAAVPDEPISPSSNASAVDRQSALLSLLSGATNAPNNIGIAGAGPQQQHTQIPTPPGSAPSHSETQGKMLLEQLMSG